MIRLALRAAILYLCPLMNPASKHIRVFLGAVFVAALALAPLGCTERNMGKADGDGWTKVQTGGKSSAPAAPLQHAEAVNVTYYYLPG